MLIVGRAAAVMAWAAAARLHVQLRAGGGTATPTCAPLAPFLPSLGGRACKCMCLGV